MSDRELLKLAAKAAGIDALHDPQGVLRDCTGFHESMNIFAAKPWNPLTDDGDALRLAVKLKFDLEWLDVIAIYADGSCCTDECHYAAARRAIVRAAAQLAVASDEIGEKM